MCHGLADAGATIVAIARNQDKLDALTTALSDKGIKIIGISADVLDKSALENAAKQVTETLWAC